MKTGSKYSKSSLEVLKERIDLVEVLSSYMDLRKSGATHKGLCPFHEEKSPSFVVKSGDSHYHCFGCGAHGDAIAFLMTYLRLSFAESVELLAEKFHVTLETSYEREEKGPFPSQLKETLEIAKDFFHCMLLYTEEGCSALQYLFDRGLSLDFIRRFELGWAPTDGALFYKVAQEKKITTELLEKTGLVTRGGRHPFFRERITFPIRNPFGNVIGFSARKIREETFGGKYINTGETPLFKKSKVLYGLEIARREIAKSRKCIVVEGQIDCLRMIDAGFETTVAALGTAFGSSHVAELEKLGCQEAILLFDGDDAGIQAASKVGDLFQKVGIEVKVVSLPKGMDPDLFLRRKGVAFLKELLERAESYLSFQFSFLSLTHDPTTPAGKNGIAREMSTQINNWDHPIMVHESLKKLSSLVAVPEDVMGITSYAPRQFVTKTTNLGLTTVDPNWVLELDLLRWLILMGEEHPQFVELASRHLEPSDFWVKICNELFVAILKAREESKPINPLTLIADVDEEAGGKCLEEIYSKKINRERAELNLTQTIQKLLDRRWLHKREEIKMQIHSGQYSEEEVLRLAKEFDALKKPSLQ